MAEAASREGGKERALSWREEGSRAEVVASPWPGREATPPAGRREAWPMVKERRAEQMVPCFEPPVSPLVASIFSVKVVVRLCPGQRKLWEMKRLKGRISWSDSGTQRGY